MMRKYLCRSLINILKFRANYVLTVLFSRLQLGHSVVLETLEETLYSILREWTDHHGYQSADNTTSLSLGKQHNGKSIKLEHSRSELPIHIRSDEQITMMCWVGGS